MWYLNPPVGLRVLEQSYNEQSIGRDLLHHLNICQTANEASNISSGDPNSAFSP